MHLMPSKQLFDRPFNCQSWQGIEETARYGETSGCKFDQYAISLGPGQDIFNIAVERLFNYKIYPSERMMARVCSPEGRVIKGCIIVQRIFLGLVGFEAAVRVVDVFDIQDQEKRKTGYSYVTLKGHPESGVVTFSVEQRKGSENILLVIESWSKPGNLFAVLFRPIARFIQKKTSDQALLSFKNGVVHEN